MRFNALWWWIDRWRKSTAYTDMTLEQQGAYRNLLDEANLRGGALPNDERILAKACGDAKRWNKVRGAVLARFVLQSDGWHNETLDDVIRRSAELAAHRSTAGQAGNEKRWGSDTHAARTRAQRVIDARTRGSHTAEEWAEMRALYRRCLRCGIAEHDLVEGTCVKDHIVPLYQGGDDSIQNLQPLCRPCNSAKGRDRKDYRVDLPETPIKWLANRSQSGSQSGSLLSPDPDPDKKQIHEERAGARVRVSGSIITTDTQGAEAARFIERYQQLYSERRHGAKLRLKPNLDWMRALELLQVWDFSRLEKLAIILLETDEEWIAKTDRGVAVFAAKASWCDDRLTAAEHGAGSA